MAAANEQHDPTTAGSIEALDDALHNADFIASRRLIANSAPRDEDTVLAILARHARTDPAAVELLLEVLDSSGVVRRFAGAALLDHSAVDDVSQNALISIADSIANYDGRGKVTTWVHSIVRRRVVDHLRRQRSTVPLEEGDLSPAARMSSIIATRTTVHEALKQLPELYRAPVVLRDIEGHTYAAIAQQLDRAEGTVKAQINRGRALVAAHLQRNDEAQP